MGPRVGRPGNQWDSPNLPDNAEVAGSIPASPTNKVPCRTTQRVALWNRLLRSQLGFDEPCDRFDQSEMGEGLGKVTKVLACGAIDLLFVEEEWSGKRKELLTQTPCPRRLADYGQR
jgi:hypothetical protein